MNPLRKGVGAVAIYIGVSIAWIINVKLLPYPSKPASLSYLLYNLKRKKTGSAEP